MNIKKFLFNKNVKNASWLMAGNIVHMLLSFIIGLFTARYLGPGNYGLINYASTYTTFFTSVCTLGISSVIVKNFVDYPHEEGKTLGTTIALRILASAFSLGMITLIVYIADAGEKTTIFVTFLYSLGLFFSSFDIFRQWFQAKLKSKYYAITNLIAYLISSLYKLFLLIKGASVAWFAVAN